MTHEWCHIWLTNVHNFFLLYFFFLKKKTHEKDGLAFWGLFIMNWVFINGWILGHFWVFIFPCACYLCCHWRFPGRFPYFLELEGGWMNVFFVIVVVVAFQRVFYLKYIKIIYIYIYIYIYIFFVFFLKNIFNIKTIQNH